MENPSYPLKDKEFGMMQIVFVINKSYRLWHGRSACRIPSKSQLILESFIKYCWKRKRRKIMALRQEFDSAAKMKNLAYFWKLVALGAKKIRSNIQVLIPKHLWEKYFSALYNDMPYINFFNIVAYIPCCLSEWTAISSKEVKFLID